MSEPKYSLEDVSSIFGDPNSAELGELSKDRDEIGQPKWSPPSKELEEISSIFRDAPSQTVVPNKDATKNKSIVPEILDQFILEDYPIAGGIAGSVAGGAEMLSSGKRWALPVVGRSYSDVAESSTEMAKAYQRAKHKGPAFEKWNKLFTPAAPGEEANAFKRMLARSALPQRIFEASSRLPFGSTAMGALGGLQAGQAIERAREGDIAGAAISGVGGLGSLASLIPKVAPRLIGGAAGLASIPAQFVYEAIKGIPKERMENVFARQQFEAMPEQPSEQEIIKARIAGPALSQMNLQMQNPTRFAGGLRNIQ